MMYLLSPLSFFWLLLLLALVFYKIRRVRTAKGLCCAALLLLFICSSTPLPVFLAKKLEEKYPVCDLSKFPGAHIPILVLGAGHFNDPQMTPMNQLSEPGLNRLVQGVILYRKFPGNKFITSGYSFMGGTSNAQVMAKTAVILGVDPKDTIMMTKPTSTWDEAVEIKKHVDPSKPFFLVTSAIHMPRSMETFNRFGLHPIPVPTNHLIKAMGDSSIYSWMPSWSNILITERVLHEYSGTFYYRWFKNPDTKIAAP